MCAVDVDYFFKNYKICNPLHRSNFKNDDNNNDDNNNDDNAKMIKKYRVLFVPIFFSFWL